ncbi:uncharacterized protein HD556DRAFT_1430168 [Suillus plorans]|uniref:DUF2421 domain-containing protein n=1 Tax=Suillus plorans TaxID=116603 RepID=A0A9P7DQT9_9AGAM|nr:uncharacterized protein HD556DRAFT_1430168 [Suillus plorans]KAG1800779.1 hypothetical protein HD556DRAFT_1430168 [Suillus plorans]
MEEYGAPITHDAFKAETTLSAEEVHQGVAFVDQQDDTMSQEVSYSHATRNIPTVPHHLQHATKNAIGVAMLSFLAFLPSHSAGFQWFRWIHSQWMIISYVWVLETNTGVTWRSGTILGATYAYITWAICGRNPIGIVAMVTLFDIPITWLVMKSRIPSLDLAWMRASMIALGIIAALIMNSLVFPQYSQKVLFLNQTSTTLRLLSQLYLLLVQGMFRSIYPFTPHDKQEVFKLELQIRNKPMHHYREVVLKIQKILDLMTGLRKIWGNIPQKETIVSVMKERKEFISCICISLFACQHIFQARQPLPQFLPSARQALETLESRIEASLRWGIDSDVLVKGISLAYSVAEGEVMKDMVDTIEGLLELCRQLFGTSAWLTHTTSVYNADEGPGTPSEGWFSTVGRM